MRELPILFSGDMVRATLDGRKTMTRRVVKPQPLWIGEPNVPFKTQDADHNGIINSPYQPGDILYVRETWRCVKYDSTDGDLSYGVEFKDGVRKYFEFDDNERFHQFGKFAFKDGWQSSMFMPKEAARIWLEVTDVRVERLQDITPHDAWNEGCRIGNSFPWEEHIPELQQQCRDIVFIDLWDSIYAKRGYGWDSNCWVWSYEFKRLEGYR